MNPASEELGAVQSTVSRIYRKFLPLIEEVLCMRGPELVEAFAKRIVIIDGTLIPTGNHAGQMGNYSGKRHKSGVGIQVASGESACLLGVSEPYAGSMHDRRALTETGWEKFLADVCALGDPGYQGTSLITPTKKPRGGELSENEKEANRKISGIRSAVERAIAHLKNWKILATGYRGRLAELPNVLRIITRLEFHRLGW